MASDRFLVHCALALTLFLIINWVGRHSKNAGYLQLSVFAKSDEAPAFNFLYRAVSPVVFMVLVGAALHVLGLTYYSQKLYLVVAYYFAFRIIFNVVMGRSSLLNWWSQTAHIFFSLPIAYYVYNNLVVHQQFLFPQKGELGSAVWISIIAFFYQTLNNMQVSSAKTIERKSRFLANRYSRYEREYGDLIRKIVYDKKQEMLVFAVLIYEDFNRPKPVRLLEKVMFPFGVVRTLGIMQVETRLPISDRESVAYGAEKIVNDFDKAKDEIKRSGMWVAGPWGLRREVLAFYNRDDDYVMEVEQIYNELIKAFAPEVEEDWRDEINKIRSQMDDLPETGNPGEELGGWRSANYYE